VSNSVVSASSNRGTLLSADVIGKPCLCPTSQAAGVVEELPNRSVVPLPMAHALPELTARAKGPGVAIRWEDFNYPPKFHLIHFDINEMPFRLRKTVRMFNMSFLLTCTACLVNILDNFALWLWDVAPVHWVVQAALQLLMLAPAALVVFYIGYRGLASPDMLLIFRFQLAQGLLGVAALNFAVIPYRCNNGLLRLLHLQSLQLSTGVRLYWNTAIVVESMFWMSIAFLAAINVAQMRRASIRPAGDPAAQVVGKV